MIMFCHFIIPWKYSNIYLWIGTALTNIFVQKNENKLKTEDSGYFKISTPMCKWGIIQNFRFSKFQASV